MDWPIPRTALRPLLAALLLAMMACKSAPPAADTPTSERGSTQQLAADAAPAPFDYYLLSLSWAPNFCADHRGPATECAPGRHVSFVLHGLWPQMEQGRPQEHCQHTSPVASDVVRYALNFYPSAGLIRHEWECHGINTGLSAGDYFTAAGHAFQQLKVPDSFASLAADTRMDTAGLARQFEQVNSAPANSFVTTCHDGELVGVEACFTRDLRLRPCAPSLRSCSGTLLLRAPR